MKKRHGTLIGTTLLATALFGIGALPAFAQYPPPPPYPSNINSSLDLFGTDILLQSTDQLSLTVNPYPNPPNEQGGGFFVGLTTGYINDVTTGQSSDPFYMFCVDFNDEINPQVTYNTTIESLVGPLLPDPNPIGETLATLQLQAILGSYFGTSPSGNAALDTETQDDIWNLDNPSAGLPGDTHNQLVNAEAAYIAGQNYSNSFVFDVTPYPGAPGQAFMPFSPGGFNNSSGPPPTPEPGTWAMLGLSLIGLGSLKLRKSQR